MLRTCLRRRETLSGACSVRAPTIWTTALVEPGTISVATLSVDRLAVGAVRFRICHSSSVSSSVDGMPTSSIGSGGQQAMLECRMRKDGSADYGIFKYDDSNLAFGFGSGKG